MLRKSLEKAFKVWEQAADVKFSKVVIPPEDIQIRWGLRIAGIYRERGQGLLGYTQKIFELPSIRKQDKSKARFQLLSDPSPIIGYACH